MKKIQRIFRDIAKKNVEILVRVLWIFPIKKNKIIFSAFGARTYGDNPKYIAEEILRENLKYDLVFVLRDVSISVPDGIRKVKYNSLKYLYEMATAKIWIDNTRKETYIVKRKKQYYIQTWHGGVSIKKIEKDAEKKLAIPYIKTAKADSKKINLLITNSDWGEKQLERCFWYNGKILNCGSPKVDILFKDNENLKRKIKKDLGILEKKVILYAPTFRENKNVDVYDIDYLNLQKTLKQKFGDDWKVIVRLHPNISKLEYKLPDNVLNVSSYPDINELYAISDIMITDYSSSIFDFSNLFKPIFLYANDIEEYLKERDTYFELRKLPFDFAENNIELLNNIKKFEQTDYLNRLKQFHKDIGLNEHGTACKEIINIIKKEMAY